MSEIVLTDREDIVPCVHCGCGAQYNYGDQPVCTVHAMKSGDWLGYLIRSTQPAPDTAPTGKGE